MKSKLQKLHRDEPGDDGNSVCFSFDFTYGLSHIKLILYHIYMFLVYNIISYMISYHIYYSQRRKGTISDTNPRYETCSHFWENVRLWGVEQFDLGGSEMSKNNFKICSHIQKKTHNPNTIFKLTIDYTKSTKDTEILSKPKTKNSKTF